MTDRAIRRTHPDGVPPVRRRELAAWAFYDFANSGYTTVVITAIFGEYFVSVVAGRADWATFAWTAALSVSYALIMVSAPLLGAWAVAPLAGEWIHYAALAIKAQIPLGVLRDTVAQFPTYCEGYLNAIEALSEFET